MAVTPNRPDALCHLGLAREIFTGLKFAQLPCEWIKENSLTQIETSLKEVDHLTFQHAFTFQAKSPENIPAFFLGFENISVQPSPLWLRTTLENLGINSINNIVDISNYILLMYGHPSHAFDVHKLPNAQNQEKQLVLRYAKKEEAKNTHPSSTSRRTCPNS